MGYVLGAEVRGDLVGNGEDERVVEEGGREGAGRRVGESV